MCCSYHRSTDAFIGMATMGKNMTVQRLKDALSNVFDLDGHFKNSVIRSCELMVHPGYPCRNGGCGQGPDDFSQSDDRPHEMKIIQSHDLFSFYKENNIQLTPYPV